MTAPQLGRRPLGGTGIELATVGCGVSEAATSGRVEELLIEGLGLGINWMELFETYEPYRTEHRVGRFLSSLNGSRPYVVARCGLMVDLSAPGTHPEIILTPGIVRGSCERTLRHLGIDSIDVFMLPAPEDIDIVPIEETWGEVGELVREGKVRAAGLAGFSLPLIVRCERERHVDAVELGYLAAPLQATRNVALELHLAGIGVILRLTSFPRGDRTAAVAQSSPGVDRGSLRRHVRTDTRGVSDALQIPGVVAVVGAAEDPGDLRAWAAAASAPAVRRFDVEAASAVTPASPLLESVR